MTTVALIISTYNWTSALDLVIQSALEQSRRADEIIIADDGSDSATAALIENYRQQAATPIIHAWQADEGFRAARSRNNAAKHASSDYLIFIDGDTVLHQHFIADHLRFAAVDTFVVGSRVLLDKAVTTAYFKQQQFDFSIFTTAADNKLNAVHLPIFTKLFCRSRRHPLQKLIFKVRSCNMAVWRRDYFAVNGFNHAFCGWGREDSEFALRLFKKGLAMRRLKFAAIQYHLYHRENDRNRLQTNDELLAATLDNADYRCLDGIDSLTDVD